MRGAPALPAGFAARTMAAPGGDLHVQVGGAGDAVVLLHGYVQSGDMWGPLAAALTPHRTVIVPDLRGLARSTRPVAGYDKRTQAQDLHGIVRALGFERTALVAHDIGAMVAYAYAAQFPAEVERLAVLDAPLPGVGPWETQVRHPGLWHFDFNGPHAERLVAGRERIWFDRFWDFAADPTKIGDAVRDHYAAQYAAPGAMGAGFGQFAAFRDDAQDNARLRRTKLTMPVLAVGGEHAFGTDVAETLRAVATDVREQIVPGTGHWLMEEAPDAVVPLLTQFLADTRP